MEEEDEKYQQISQQEAKDIDTNKVSYYTLLDGTVVYVKKDGEAGEGSPVQGSEAIRKEEQELLSQNKSNSVEAQIQSQNEQNIELNKDIYTSESNQINQQQNTLSSQEFQDQGQIQTQSQNQQILTGSENENAQLNTEINTDTNNVIQSQNRRQNNQVILQPGDNFAYSSIRMENKTQQKPQIQMCPTCNYNFSMQKGPGQFVAFNAKLIEAHPQGFNGRLYKVQNLQPFSQSQTQLFPKKRQLYKLIEAVPIKVSGMNLVNRNTNTKLNLVNSNSYTYLVENTNNNRSTFNSNQYKTYTQTQKRTTQRFPYNTLTQTKSNTRTHRVYAPRFDYQDQFIEDTYNQYPQPVNMGQGEYIQRVENDPNIQQYENYEEYPNEYEQYAQLQEQEYQNEDEENNYYVSQMPNQYLLHQQYLRQYQNQEGYEEPQEVYQNEEQYQNGEQIENQRMEYCTYDRIQSESNQGKPIKYCCCGKDHSECICPIGNIKVRKEFEIVDPNSCCQQEVNEETNEDRK